MSEISSKKYVVPASALDAFLGAVARFNRRALKLGCAEAQVVVGPERLVNEDAEGGVKRARIVHDVTLAAAPAQIAGWTFIGHVALEDGIELLFATPGESIPASMRGRGSVCDHCGHDRKRNATYVLRSEAGEVKAVGRQCLQAFLGVSAHHLAAWTLAVGELGAMLDDEEGMRRGHWSPTYELESFLAAADTVIRVFGWLSRGAARGPEGGIATADTTLLYLSGQVKSKEDQKLLEQAAPKVNMDEIRAACLWAAQQADSDNDYLHNVGAVGTLGAVTLRSAGVAASILAAYRRNVAEKAAASKSLHAGEKGKRGSFDVKVVAIMPLRSSTLVKMHTQEGALLCWFASTLENEFKVGAELHIAATVKEHGEFRGEKQTIVGRVSIKVKKEKKPRAPRKPRAPKVETQG